MHLVRGRPPTAAPASPAASQPAPAATNTGMPTSPFGGLGGAFGGLGGSGSAPGGAGFGANMGELMNNPMVQQLLQDETFMQNMLENNPRIQRLMESNPEMAAVLRNPELMRETMQAMRNPAAMQEMQRNADRALMTIENHPEGWRMLQSLYTQMEDPLDDIPSQLSQTSSNNNSSSSTAQAPRPESASPNSAALPNPWAPRGTTNESLGPLANIPFLNNPLML